MEFERQLNSFCFEIFGFGELNVKIKCMVIFNSNCSYLTSPQQNVKPPSCTAAFTGGISIGNKAQDQAKNQGNWSHVQPPRPVHSGYVQPQYNQQSQPPFQNEPAYAVNQNQYQPQQVQSSFIYFFFFWLCFLFLPHSLHTAGISIKSKRNFYSSVRVFFFFFGRVYTI